MGRQWLRYCRLTVGGREIVPDAEDPSAGVRVRFQVHHASVPTPNVAQVRIYNLSQATAALPQPGTEVTLEAGYVEGERGVIFTGRVKQALRGKETPVDTYLHLNCADDWGHKNATVSKSLAKGSTGKQTFDVAMAELQKFGVSLGGIGQRAAGALGKLKYPRSQAFFGMAREILHTLASTVEAQWSVQNGKLFFTHLDDTMGGPVNLSPSTGLIGMPVETTGGIIIRALINPAFEVVREVTLDPGSIQRALVAPDIRFEANQDLLDQVRPLAGTYKIIAIDWDGDTRGQEWYATLTCYGAGGSIPKGQITSDVIMGPNG